MAKAAHSTNVVQFPTPERNRWIQPRKAICPDALPANVVRLPTLDSLGTGQSVELAVLLALWAAQPREARMKADLILSQLSEDGNPVTAAAYCLFGGRT
jgi:hypothetical protein